MADLAGWEAALDDLERQLDSAARAMVIGGPDGEAGSDSPMAISTSSINDKDHSTSAADGSISSGEAAVGDWTAPTGLDALPAELATRVQDLLHNQQKLIGELEQARRLTLKHLAAVRSVPPERDARASVYLDVAG